jgi:acetyltransferase-like isoleucine patch superfamily enzyme
MEILRKIIGYSWGFIWSFVRFGKGSFICKYGLTKIIRRHSIIYVGDRTTIWPGVKFSVAGKAGEEAKLLIGKRCSIGDRTEIHCGKSITIGNDVIIAWDCNILDRDYHSTQGSEEKCYPVYIGDCVWIGCRAIILKGVSIGKGSIVGAGSVVTKSVPENSLVVGNPAKCVKKVTGWNYQA